MAADAAQPGGLSPRQMRHLARTQGPQLQRSFPKEEQDPGLDIPVAPAGQGGIFVKAEPSGCDGGSAGAEGWDDGPMHGSGRKLPLLPVRRKLVVQAGTAGAVVQSQCSADPPCSQHHAEQAAVSPRKGGTAPAGSTAAPQSPKGRRPTSPRAKLLMATSSSPKKRSGRAAVPGQVRLA